MAVIPVKLNYIRHATPDVFSISSNSSNILLSTEDSKIIDIYETTTGLLEKIAATRMLRYSNIHFYDR